jgi:hypothetical protein
MPASQARARRALSPEFRSPVWRLPTCRAVSSSADSTPAAPPIIDRCSCPTSCHYQRQRPGPHGKRRATPRSSRPGARDSSAKLFQYMVAVSSTAATSLQKPVEDSTNASPSVPTIDTELSLEQGISQLSGMLNTMIPAGQTRARSRPATPRGRRDKRIFILTGAVPIAWKSAWWSCGGFGVPWRSSSPAWC